MNKRLTRAVQGWRPSVPDSDFEVSFTEHLRRYFKVEQLDELYERYLDGDGDMDGLIRRAVWRVRARSFGQGVTISPGARFEHIETFEIGDEVFIGPGAHLRSRPDGVCRIGNSVWIGPGARIDARRIVLGDYVSWGANARVIGLEEADEVPLHLIRLPDVLIKPVIVEHGADIGAGSAVLSGVTIGAGAIVERISLVASDVPANAVFRGAPAEFVDWRSPMIEEPPLLPEDIERLFREAVGASSQP